MKKKFNNFWTSNPIVDTLTAAKKLASYKGRQ